MTLAPSSPALPLAWPGELTPVFDAAITCSYASLTRDGRPVTTPLTPYRDAATLDVSTGLTYPTKAERARRDPRVALLFSDPVGTGSEHPPVVLVQGLATVRDADLQAGLDRYVRAVTAKLPDSVRGTPWMLLRRAVWYYARIWVEVTPLRMTWWEDGRLDRSPQVWAAPAGTTAPPSDPAPRGATPPAWRDAPKEWRSAADRAGRLGAPVVTLLGQDGWPVPVPAQDVERVEDGFVVTLAAGAADLTSTAGPACLTFQTHEERFTGQENVSLVGAASVAGDRVHVVVERALPDFSLPGGAVNRARTFSAAGRALAARVATEAARRDQPVPRVPRRRPAP